MPTGVFVRIGLGARSRVDFETGGSTPLRLDQIDALCRLIDDIRHAALDVDSASGRLRDLLTAPPRFGGLVAVLGSGILTIDLGAGAESHCQCPAGIPDPGSLVGGMPWWADREPVLWLVLPVATTLLVTWVVFECAAEALDAPGRSR